MLPKYTQPPKNVADIRYNAVKNAIENCAHLFNPHMMILNGSIYSHVHAKAQNKGRTSDSVQPKVGNVR